MALALAANVELLHMRMGAQEVGISAWALATLQPKGWRKVLRGRGSEGVRAISAIWMYLGSVRVLGVHCFHAVSILPSTSTSASTPLSLSVCLSVCLSACYMETVMIIVV